MSHYAALIARNAAAIRQAYAEGRESTGFRVGAVALYATDETPATLEEALACVDREDGDSGPARDLALMNPGDGAGILYAPSPIVLATMEEYGEEYEDVMEFILRKMVHRVPIIAVVVEGIKGLEIAELRPNGVRVRFSRPSIYTSQPACN